MRLNRRPSARLNSNQDPKSASGMRRFIDNYRIRPECNPISPVTPHQASNFKLSHNRFCTCGHEWTRLIWVGVCQACLRKWAEAELPLMQSMVGAHRLGCGVIPHGESWDLLLARLHILSWPKS